MKAIFTLVALITISAPAFARDSSHLVCTGFMTSQPDPENYGIAIQFDEHRSSNGSSRVEMLSSVWQGNLFQGIRLNKTDGFGQSGVIVMAEKGHPANVYYKGTYDIVENKKSGQYQLQLRGQLSVEPGTQQSQAISTTLNCVDISN